MPDCCSDILATLEKSEWLCATLKFWFGVLVCVFSSRPIQAAVI